jgi:hypothetical protein
MPVGPKISAWVEPDRKPLASAPPGPPGLVKPRSQSSMVFQLVVQLAVKLDHQSLEALALSALTGLANATAAHHSAAPRITFFISPPLGLKITDDVAELACTAGDYVVNSR